MDNTTSYSPTIPTMIIIQPTVTQTDSKSNKRILHLGWMSFILGFCAFIIHYLSLDRLGNFSPINSGIISGCFLMISGLASVVAGHKTKSYRHFIHAHIWSFITNIIIAPGLIAVSITALIIDSNELQPICQPTVSLLRKITYHNSLEAKSLNLPCIHTINLFNLTQILNAFQLIIGVLCFIIHMFLLSTQRKLIKKMKIQQNCSNSNIIFHAQLNANNQSKTSLLTRMSRFRKKPVKM